MIIKLLLDSPATRMDNIFRFNGDRFIGRQQSLSEHSYWVILAGQLLAEQLVGKKARKTGAHWYYKFYHDLMVVLTLHDFDEVITGDILHTTKHHPLIEKEINAELHELILCEINEMRRRQDLIAQRYHEHILCENPAEKINHNLIQKITKVSDWISCFVTSQQQVEIGNSKFKKISALCLNKMQPCLEALRKCCVENLPNGQYDIEIIDKLNGELKQQKLDNGYK